MRNIPLFFILIGFTCIGYGQKLPLDQYIFPKFHFLDSTLQKDYPFIRFEKNQFQFYTPKSDLWEAFGKAFLDMTTTQKGQLNFYHIGGSHLQADIYSHDIRTHLQTYWENIPGARGMVFPFDLAKTNNPWNYEFSSPNTWKSYKSVGRQDEPIHFGVLGAVIKCYDSIITMSFRHDKTKVTPPYTTLRIVHNQGEFPFDLQFGEYEILVDHYFEDTLLGYTEIQFVDPVETMDLEFTKITKDTFPLEIHGFQFLNKDPGCTYNSIGINGAGLYTYLANDRFEKELKILPPDFFVFSVGTNDANVPYDRFDPETYKCNLDKMIHNVWAANPSCAILLTVPNDAYYFRKYPNKNVEREREVIIELAQEYELAVWDLYGLMGELGSSNIWYQQGLMQSDRIHFTAKGYHLKGDIFFDAFLKFLEQMRTLAD